MIDIQQLLRLNHRFEVLFWIGESDNGTGENAVKFINQQTKRR